LRIDQDQKPTAGESASENGKVKATPTVVRAASRTAPPAKKKATPTKPCAAPATNTGQAGRRPARTSRSGAKTEQLVCRYCGSDDLAPSFIKRRDARCRACFKQRYGSGARDKKTTPVRKTKATK
jgi:hypothetical protein